MSLFESSRVAIRVAVNEFQSKSLNPHVPYGPEEVAAEAIACARAGASIVHFHSRNADGSQALDDDSNGANVYRRAMELTARESDILMEPTNISRGADPSLAVEVPQAWALLDKPPRGARLEVMNIDGFRFDHKRTAWDEERRRLLTIRDRRIDRDAPFEGPEIIRETLRRGLVPMFGVFDLADVRLLAAFARGGFVPQPVLVQINFFCDMMKGPTPSVEALDAFLAEWRRQPIDSELFLFVRAMPDRAGYERLFTAALERGVHPRVGLGDNPHLFKGGNAEAVEHMLEIAEHRGLSPVSPSELRTRIGIRVSALHEG
jgi:3-keto-5-aminohexanoate cleavage enzyme